MMVIDEVLTVLLDSGYIRGLQIAHVSVVV